MLPCRWPTRRLGQAQALGGVAHQTPALQRVRGAALAASGDAVGALAALRQSLRAAQLREAEYEAALTMRVLAALEPDPAEQEALARSAAATLTKLRVEWSPDLLSLPPAAVCAASGPGE